jgi:hypothetical protein
VCSTDQGSIIYRVGSISLIFESDLYLHADSPGSGRCHHSRTFACVEFPVVAVCGSGDFQPEMVQGWPQKRTSIQSGLCNKLFHRQCCKSNHMSLRGALRCVMNGAVFTTSLATEQGSF